MYLKIRSWNFKVIFAHKNIGRRVWWENESFLKSYYSLGQVSEMCTFNLLKLSIPMHSAIWVFIQPFLDIGMLNLFFLNICETCLFGTYWYVH